MHYVHQESALRCTNFAAIAEGPSPAWNNATPKFLAQKKKGPKENHLNGDVKCAMFAVPSLFASSFLKPAKANGLLPMFYNSATLHSRDPDPTPDTRSCLFDSEVS